LLRGADGGSWYAVPPHIIPERGYFTCDGIKTAGAQSRDVLDDDVFWSEFSDDSRVLEPKARTLASEPRTFASIADIGARESTAEDIDVGEVVASNGSDVIEPPCIWPVSCEHRSCILILLHLPNSFAYTCTINITPSTT
jgi:hypothetical protein